MCSFSDKHRAHAHSFGLHQGTWLNAFLLILWSGGISYVRPFFPPRSRKDRVPGDPRFWRNGRVEFSFLVYTISKNALASITNDPCRYTGADRHGRQIRGYHSSGSNHRAITDRDAGGYHGVRSQPYIIADADGCIPAGLIANQFTSGYSMIGREDRYARAEEHVASDSDWAPGRGPYGTEMIDKGVVTDLDHLRVLEDHCGRNLYSLTQAFQLCLA